jgi:1-aminocyclopropane-1-carboxylate deaminase
MVAGKLDLNLPSPLQPLFFSEWKDFPVSIYIKRDDLIHPDIPGNKWRKLSGHLHAFHKGDYQRLLTFGGAYSNHIQATAAACHYMGIPSVGMIRGELHGNNPVLKAAARFGMELYPLSRQDYRNKDSTGIRQRLQELFGSDTYIVPEGGAGPSGVLGCTEIIHEIRLPFDAILCACGTGTTLAGLSSALPEGKIALGISVLKGDDLISADVSQLSGRNNFQILWDYHFGGYAKSTPELMSFMQRFNAETSIPLEHVYTAKLMMAVDDLLRKEFFLPGSRIVLLHTGGV